MAMNPIPPQAYTKDSMLKAYAWLQNQDASIREMATTPDILVSLYLKATRDGDGALDRPSIQNFKHELKQLAGLMGEFDKEAPPVEAKPKSSEPLASHGPAKRESQSKPLESFSLDFPALEKKFNATVGAPQTISHVTAALPASSMSVSGLELDMASVAIIAEIRQKLNLSSNTEALKMLIQVGYNKTKKLL